MLHSSEHQRVNTWTISSLSTLRRSIFSEFHLGFKALTTWKYTFYIGFFFFKHNVHYFFFSLLCTKPYVWCFASSGRKKKKSVYFLYFKRENYIHWPPGISEISNCSINSPISYNHPDVSVRLNGLYTCFIILVKFLLVKF